MEKIFLFLLLILTAGSLTITSQTISNNQAEIDGSNNVRFLNGDNFSSRLAQNRDMDYDTRTTLLLESPCWKSGKFEADFFVLLFNYMIVDSKNNEEFSESLSDHLYNICIRHPNIFSQFEYFINLTEDEYQEGLWNNILSNLFFEVAVQNIENDEMPLTEMDFFRLFPALSNKENSVRIHNIIEKYYEE